MAHFDSEAFIMAHHVQSWPAGSKNVPKGCIGVRCPFCGDTSNHMHFRLGTLSVKCWRCGKKRLSDAIAGILHIPIREAIEEMRRFIKEGEGVQWSPGERKPNAKQLIWPGGCGPLQDPHRRYLENPPNKHPFDSYELERIWQLWATNHIDPNYCWSIIAPLYWRGQPISYQALDVTGKRKQKYRAAPPQHEVTPHYNMLYGADQALALATGRVAVVEGITDAWRLGPGAVGTYGVEWSPAQAILLARHWNEIFLFYDPDDAGEKGALGLFYFLRGFGKNIHNMRIKTGGADPGALNPEDARYIMENEFKIRKRGWHGY